MIGTAGGTLITVGGTLITAGGTLITAGGSSQSDIRYLINELINDVPQPLVRNLQIHRLFGT